MPWRCEIERAYAEWAKYVQVTFTRTNNSTVPQTLAVLFASGAHGDGYPFTGPGGVLAHTFYPYPAQRRSRSRATNISTTTRVGKSGPMWMSSASRCTKQDTLWDWDTPIVQTM